MRLGIYVPVFERQPAGLGRYVLEMGSQVVRAADEVVIFTATPETVPSSWRTATLQVVDLWAGIRKPSSSWSRQAGRMMLVSTRLPIETRRHGLDVLWAPTQEASPFSLVPQVPVVHDLTALRFPSEYFSRAGVLYLQRVLPVVVRNASAVVAVSENTRSDLIELLGVDREKIRVIGEGYDTGVYHVPAEDTIARVRRKFSLERPYLMYSGTFAAHKNLVLLPKVLRRCIDQGFEIELAITGRVDAGGREAFLQSARDYRVEEHVRSLGYVEREELSPLMNGALAFVFPSLYEGFGLAPLEAMASGACVLSSSAASLPEVVGDGGMLLNPNDVDLWVEAVLSLAKEGARSHDLRRRAREQALTHSWETSAQELIFTLEQVCR